MELTQEQIEKKIAELTEQRDNFVTQANQQIASLNGALAVYQELLSQIMVAKDATINDPVIEKLPPQRHRHAPRAAITVNPVKPT